MIIIPCLVRINQIPASASSRNLFFNAYCLAQITHFHNIYCRFTQILTPLHKYTAIVIFNDHFLPHFSSLGFLIYGLMG